MFRANAAGSPLVFEHVEAPAASLLQGLECEPMRGGFLLYSRPSSPDLPENLSLPLLGRRGDAFIAHTQGVEDTLPDRLAAALAAATHSALVEEWSQRTLVLMAGTPRRLGSHEGMLRLMGEAVEKGILTAHYPVPATMVALPACAESVRLWEEMIQQVTREFYL